MTAYQKLYVDKTFDPACLQEITKSAVSCIISDVKDVLSKVGIK